MKLTIRFFIWFVISFICFSCTSKNCGLSDAEIVLALKSVEQNQSIYMNGVDVSYFDQLESCGANFYVDGKKTDFFDILKRANVNWIRLRIWVDPDSAGHGNWCNLERTVDLAKRIKKTGFFFLLDFHYSDWWADPKQQNIPGEWKNLGMQELCEAVEKYTSESLIQFVKNNAAPDMIQIGNEITNGMLWPYGSTENEDCSNLMMLVKSGIGAAKNVVPSAKIMLHLDKGSDNEFCRWWFSEAKKYEVAYDVIGLSYYPFWQTEDLSVLENNISDLKKRFNKDVCIVETAYPWTFDWADNRTNNVWKTDEFGNPTKLVKDCPATVEGQQNYLNQLNKVVKASGGCGVFWWEPDGIATVGFESDWENLTWFDFDGNWLRIGF